MTWPPDRKKPKTEQLRSVSGALALGGAFWGLLFGLLFFIPLLGMAIGAGMGALAGSMTDVGIDDDFIRKVRDEVTPGTSALFVMSRTARWSWIGCSPSSRTPGRIWPRPTCQASRRRSCGRSSPKTRRRRRQDELIRHPVGRHRAGTGCRRRGEQPSPRLGFALVAVVPLQLAGTVIRTWTASQAVRIKSAASVIGYIDVFSALAQVAVENRYTRPRFSDTGEMRIEAGRHPVIEKLTEKDAIRFIPNDLYLHSDGQFLGVITGPNMGGKSTYLRQNALILILAQMGSFVPADRALLPLVDRVFTRVGAADNLARGRSTFMVEMTETAAILSTATSNSYIVLDEIGRGTSTYDGLALAWAVAEYIHDHIRAKTLFATHYHELTDLAGKLSGVRNLHVSVKESGDQILFIRKVEPGTADRSYGIEVARLAALPLQVIERARVVLLHHERREHSVSEELAPDDSGTPIQIKLFEPVNQSLADRVRALDLDELRPIEALQILHDLQQELLKR